MLNSLFNVIGKIKDLSEDKQKKLLTYFAKIVSDPEFEEIVGNIFSIQDEVVVPSRTRQNTLERINRFTESAKTPHEFQKNSKFYKPTVNHGELIEVRFSGLGSETDQPHYAIVWKSQRASDPIVIIPTTSFKEEDTLETGSTFNIGNIGWMEKETVVLLEQITTISRKRIDQKMQHKTRKYNKSLNKMEYVTITTEQTNRIKDGFRVYHLGESTIYQYLMNNAKGKLPILSNYNEQISHLHRPFIKNVENSSADKLVYSLYEDQEKFYTIERFVSTANYTERNRLLKGWVEAKAEYDDSKERITKSRDLVRTDAYNEMKKNMVLPSLVETGSSIK